MFKGDKDFWLEYNDSKIKAFEYYSPFTRSIKKLEEECFGNFDETAKDATTKNAYMLIYERELKTPIKIHLNEAEAEGKDIIEYNNETTPIIGKIYKKENNFFTYIDFYDIQPKVPSDLLNLIKKDNDEFLLDKQVYSTRFLDFLQGYFTEVHSQLKEPKPIIEKVLSSIAIKTIFTILTHASNNSSIKSFAAKFTAFLNESSNALRQFLNFVADNFEEEILNVFCKCKYKSTKEPISNLISEATLIAFNNTELLVYATRVIDLFIENINDELAKGWLFFEQYFDTLLTIISKGSDDIKIYANTKDLIKVLIDFYLGTESPFYAKDGSRKKMGSKYSDPTFSPLIELVSLLVLHSDLSFYQPSDTQLRSKLQMPRALYEVSEESKSALTTPLFISKTIMEQHSTKGFAKFISFICYDREDHSRFIAKTILMGINRTSTQNFTTYFTVLNELFALPDTLQHQRLEWIFGIPILSRKFTQLKAKEQPHTQLKIGLELIDNLKKTVHEFPSPLAYKSRYESYLNFIWYNKKKLDITAAALLILSMAQLPNVFQYVINLPPPSYRFSKYIDWVRIRLENHKPKKFSFFESSKYEEKLCGETLQHLPKLNQQSKFKPYLIGKIKDEAPLRTETKDNVAVIISELITDCYNSQPTGRDNLTLPVDYFKLKEESLEVMCTEVSILKIEVRNCKLSFNSISE